MEYILTSDKYLILFFRNLLPELFPLPDVLEAAVRHPGDLGLREIFLKENDSGD